MHPDTARLHIDDEFLEPVQTITDYLPQALRFSGQPKSRDITKEFTQASSELGQGQLIKDEYFTLFESVGALEIMDPKMDSGFMMPEADAAVDNFDPLKPMLPEEILGIMDQMLCYEMAWHDGYPLSQTLFTSLHFTSITPQEYKHLEHVIFKSKQKRPPNPLVSDVLRAYCIGLMKSCDSVIADVISEHYYEEEDFVTQTFTQYLLSDIDDAAIIAVLEAASKTLESIDLPEDLKAAFAARLDLRNLMLKAYQPLPARFHAEKSRLWQDVLQAVVKVNETASLGKVVPGAFSERVQRHLASSTPPRPMIIISWEEAYPKLRKLCEDNIEAYRIATIEDPSPSNIIRFVEDFSTRKSSTYSRSIIQGLLFKDSKILGQIPHYDVLLTDIASLVLSADPLLSPTNWEIELPSDPRHRIARKVDEFMAKAIEEYLNIPRMLSQNRCRTRRTLNQSIAILDSLQAEAELIDSAIHTIIEEICSTSGSSSPSSARAFANSVEQLPYFPLAAWTYNHKLTISIQTVLLGFETEVYLPDEHASMYAFLAFLAQTQEEHLGHIDFFAHRRAQRLATQTRDQKLVEEVVANRAFLKILTARARARKFLAEALKGLYSLLQTLHLLRTPHRPYSTPSLRHELRMKPFLTIGTPSLPSASTLSPSPAFRPTRSIASILAGIETPLKLAKSDLNTLRTAAPELGHFKGCEGGWAGEVKGLLGSAVGVGVACAGLRAVCEKLGVADVGDVDARGRAEALGERVRVEIPVPEKRFAAGWAVPRVVEVKV